MADRDTTEGQAAAVTTPPAPPQQLRYAKVVGWGARAGMGVLVLTYVLYVAGIVEPHVPLDELHRYWRLPVDEYLQATGVEPGWGWTAFLSKGDFLNFMGVVLMASLSIFCLPTLIPTYVRKRDWIYLGIIILETGVLVLAASGILHGGGH